MLSSHSRLKWTSCSNIRLYPVLESTQDITLLHSFSNKGSAHGVNLENVDLESLLQEELKTESDRIISLQEGERLHLGREDGKPEFK